MRPLETAGKWDESIAPFESLLLETPPSEAPTPPVFAGVLSSSLGILCVVEMLSGLLLAGWLLGWGGGVLSPSFENGIVGPGPAVEPLAFARARTEDEAKLGDMSMRALKAPYATSQTSSELVRDGLAGGAPPRISGQPLDGVPGLREEDGASRSDSQWLVKW